VAQSEGKLFEQAIKNSVPKDCYYYRFIDNAASFSGGENTRFTSYNLCDGMIMTKDILYLMELKSHKGTSLPLSCIRKNQIEGMKKIEHPRIRAIFIINFRDKEKTYAIDAKQLGIFIETTERKSIPIAWCEENGILIDARKKKVRYLYNLEKFFEDATIETCR